MGVRVKRIQVESGNIKSIGWKDETLEVEFINSNIYKYHPITEDQYQKLKSAPSIGSHFYNNIRDKAGVTCTCIKRDGK
jgi:hypothetical protein